LKARSLHIGLLLLRGTQLQRPFNSTHLYWWLFPGQIDSLLGLFCSSKSDGTASHGVLAEVIGGASTPSYPVWVRGIPSLAYIVSPVSLICISFNWLKGQSQVFHTKMRCSHEGLSIGHVQSLHAKNGYGYERNRNAFGWKTEPQPERNRNGPGHDIIGAERSRR